MDDNSIKITITIGGFKEKLTIDRAEEELYRAAAANLAKLYQQALRAFSAKPVEELWMITAYQTMVTCLRQQSDMSGKQAAEQLSRIEQQIDWLLNPA